MDSTVKIGDRIRALREEKGLTQQALADALHVKRETINMWENGLRDLKTGSVIALSDFFCVSSDYILGRTGIKAQDANMKFIYSKTGLTETAISSLCELNSNYPELVNTAISLVSDFDNMFWITASIHDIARQKAIVSSWEDWAQTNKGDLKKAEFYVAMHTDRVKTIRHAFFDCIESFRSVIDRMSDSLADELKGQIEISFESMYQEWSTENGKT